MIQRADFVTQESDPLFADITRRVKDGEWVEFGPFTFALNYHGGVGCWRTKGERLPCRRNGRWPSA
jgi:hypothetical protein